MDKSGSNSNDNFENVPVAELDLDLPPLKVMGQKRSDKYLEQKVKKDKKRGKKKKKHRKSER